MSAHIWRLHVGTSGDPERAASPVTLAGLLLRASVTELGDGVLRRCLEESAPGHPWPLDPRWILRPSMVALAWERSASPTASPDPVMPWVIGLLEQAEPESVGRVRAALAQDAEPPQDDVTRLDRALLHDQPDWCRRLANRGRLAHRRLELVISHALDRANAREFVPPAALIFATGEAAQGDALPEETRYLTLLEVMLLRVARVLGQHVGEHVVHVHPVGRRLPERALGREVPLHVRHVGALREEVLARLPGNVRFVPERVRPAIDPDAPAGRVLADLASHVTWREMGDVPLGWVESRLEAMGAIVRSGSTPRTHVSSSGEPHRRLLAIDDGQDPPPLSDGLRAWAVEQMLDWESP